MKTSCELLLPAYAHASTIPQVSLLLQDPNPQIAHWKFSIWEPALILFITDTVPLFQTFQEPELMQPSWSIMFWVL